jgi:hypothetical protein
VEVRSNDFGMLLPTEILLDGISLTCREWPELQLHGLPTRRELPHFSHPSSIHIDDSQRGDVIVNSMSIAPSSSPPLSSSAVRDIRLDEATTLDEFFHRLNLQENGTPSCLEPNFAHDSSFTSPSVMYPPSDSLNPTVPPCTTSSPTYPLGTEITSNTSSRVSSCRTINSNTSNASSGDSSYLRSENRASKSSHSSSPSSGVSSYLPSETYTSNTSSSVSSYFSPEKITFNSSDISSSIWPYGSFEQPLVQTPVGPSHRTLSVDHERQDTSTSASYMAGSKGTMVKRIVAIPAIRRASALWQKQGARFICDVDGCHAIFTTKDKLESESKNI